MAKQETQTKYHRRRNGVLFTILAVILIAASVVAACTVFFRVENIEVNGHSAYTAEQIIGAAEVEQGDNLFAVNKFKVMRQIISRLPYVDEISVSRRLPNTLVINVVECVPAAAIQGSDAWWIIDTKGKILERTDETRAAEFPPLTGLTPDSPVVGSQLEVAEGEENKLASLEKLFAALAARGMTDQAESFDLTAINFIKMGYGGRFTVKIPMNTDFNQAAKIRYMTGGQCNVPMVLRAPMGAGRRNAGQHSQSLENFFCHFPGLKVVAPCSAADAKGLLKTAIRDDDPVIFLEHKLLYAKKEEIPEEEYTIPLGQAAVKREGRDVSIITWSREVNFSMEAAAALAQEGIEAEVLDLRTLVPLDWDAIVRTVSKTHNVIIVSEEVKRGSFAGELSAQIGEELFDELDAPVERVCGLNICSPFSPVLEDKNFPHPEDIAAAVKRVLNK